MTSAERSAQARAVMTVREGAAEQRASRLFWLLVGALACLGVSIAGNVLQAQAPKFVPHLVMIDPQGMELWRSRNGQLSPADVDVGGFVQRWVWNSRRRGDDFFLMGEMRREAELMTSGKALRKLQAYHAETSPKCTAATKACRELKQNPIRTFLDEFRPERLNERTWAMTWREVWTPTYGELSRTLRVRLEVTIDRKLTPGPFGHALMTVKDANRSPTALYVVDYQLSEVWEDVP